VHSKIAARAGHRGGLLRSALWLLLAATTCAEALTESSPAATSAGRPVLIKYRVTGAEDAKSVEVQAVAPLPQDFPIVTGILLGLTAGLVGWALLLHKRVREKAGWIQQRLKREAALEERYQELFENASDMVYTHDLKGNYTTVNKAAERILGYTREELLNVNSFGLISMAAQSACTVLCLEGERIRLETQLRHAQKLEAVGQLAAGVAHDFNNIMTIIHGHAALLSAVPSTDPQMEESLKEIAMAADRAANLTSQLLAFSRKQIMQPWPLNLNQVIRNTAKMLRRLLGEDLSLICSYRPSLPSIHADASMMEQVLVNLAVNARDAMTKGGTLTISTSLETIESATAGLYAEGRVGQFVCLRVADTGCGMDHDTLGKIFEPFFTTKEVGKGTGLGLSMVYGIVKQHQAWIEVTSQPDQGTVFELFFPVVEQHDAPASQPPPLDYRLEAPNAKSRPADSRTVRTRDNPASRWPTAAVEWTPQF